MAPGGRLTPTDLDEHGQTKLGLLTGRVRQVEREASRGRATAEQVQQARAALAHRQAQRPPRDR